MLLELSWGYPFYGPFWSPCLRCRPLFISGKQEDPNQYWVSYYRGQQIFDKKFIFVPDSIVPANLIPIALLGREGVLHG